MNFFVGQKVICVVHAWVWLERFGIVRPEKGGIYVVRSIVHENGRVGLHLHWLINPRIARDDTEPAFATIDECDGTINFRPVIDRPTSIEIFERLLNPGPAPVAPVEHERV